MCVISSAVTSMALHHALERTLMRIVVTHIHICYALQPNDQPNTYLLDGSDYSGYLAASRFIAQVYKRTITIIIFL